MLISRHLKTKIIHFIIPFGKFGPPYLGKATAAARVALPSPTSACWVFLCFRNPLSSDMDYRILNMLKCVHSYVCVYTQGLGTQTTSQHNIFDLDKLSHIFGGSNLGSLDLESDALPVEKPRHPCLSVCKL